MQRDVYTELLKWQSSSRRKPLILRGARQVGKTYLLKQFARDAYDNHIYINFDQHGNVADYFHQDLDPHRIIHALATYFGIEITPGKTLLIFDEIQECPEALNALKYFAEEANAYHIAAAGSLLGVTLAEAGFPVGKVTFLDVYPLSFPEYLTAIGKAHWREALETTSDIAPFPEALHQSLLQVLRLYLVVGGMPEAVSVYIESQDLHAVRDVQKNILAAYQLDFAKHAPKQEVMKLLAVWEAIPKQLAKENKKFIFSVVHKSARGREYEFALQWLQRAGIVYRVTQVSQPALPLSTYADQQVFKIYLLDVGLLSAMTEMPVRLAMDDSQLFTEFKGALTENFVAQSLLTSGLSALYYWTSGRTAEVNFLIQHDTDIYPLEVKAGVSRHKKSLLLYQERYHPTVLSRTTKMNYVKEGQLVNYPLYLIGCFCKLTKLK